jgi:hypothetical protein
MDNQKKILKDQRNITALVVKKFPVYYLAGGTALAFHFNHRFSEDLDFFSPQYDPDQAGEIMQFIQKKTGFPFVPDSQVPSTKKTAGMRVFYIGLSKDISMKIDFVEDVLPNTQKTAKGILSKQDIYIRKIYAAIGTKGKLSYTGRAVPGGRQSVKDLYDIYWLSLRFKRLSRFFLEFFSTSDVERLEHWYKAFDRQEAKLELLDLDVRHDPRRVFSYMDDMILCELKEKCFEVSHED